MSFRHTYSRLTRRIETGGTPAMTGMRIRVAFPTYVKCELLNVAAFRSCGTDASNCLPISDQHASRHIWSHSTLHEAKQRLPPLSRRQKEPRAVKLKRTLRNRIPDVTTYNNHLVRKHPND